MDQNKSTIPLSMSDPRPNSPSPVTGTVVLALPTTWDTSTNSGEASTNSQKRKRGRPRKYDPNDEEVRQSETPTRRSFRNHGGDMSMTRGWDWDIGSDFTPLAFTVNKGEDIIERIMSFTENGSRGITVLSVLGTVANVMIRPLSGWYPCNAVMFKDAHEIISLQGGNIMPESWRITIAGADGSVNGGALVDRLIAASPVQVMIGRFRLKVTNSPQERNNESKDVVVQPTVLDSLASSSIASSQSQKSDGESEDVVVPPSVPSVLAFEGTRHVQQPDVISPSQSQKSENESEPVIVQHTIPSALASSSTGQVQQTETTSNSPALPLGQSTSQPDLNK